MHAELSFFVGAFADSPQDSDADEGAITDAFCTCRDGVRGSEGGSREEEEKLGFRLTVFVSPSVSLAPLGVGFHGYPERAVLFVKGDDVGGEHGDEYGAFLQTIVGFGDPVHLMINVTNFFLEQGVDEEGFLILRAENVREDGGRNDDGYQESEVMNGLVGVVFGFDPVVGVVDHFMGAEGREFVVGRKGHLVEDIFHGGEGEIFLRSRRRRNRSRRRC